MKKVTSLLSEILRALWFGLCVCVSVGFVLALWLGVVRVLMLGYYWPEVGGADLWAELPQALLMGMRFDFKVTASAGLLLFAFLGWDWRLTHRVLKLYATLFVIISVVNFYYYGFYKLPIDAVIFGLLDDDTLGVLRTIWLDFPIVQIVIVLIAAVYSANFLALRIGRWTLTCVQMNFSQRKHIAWMPVLLILIMLLTKGTLKGSPLDLDNTTATSKPFLNSAVPNGVTALYNAWSTYRNSADIGDVDRGLKAMGFRNFQEAAQVLGIPALNADGVQRALMAQAPNAVNGKNLVFIQMESWSAEPFKYQSKTNDVMAGLKDQMSQAWFFDNFDSVQNGTHPALEAILFGTPVTPITSGKYRSVQLDWGVPRTFKNAGYDTVFVTSGQSGWRELNKVLLTQGFDEVLDAATLRTQYPGATGGVWGVWDSYMFRAIQDRLARQPKNRPLFIYAMSTTNHPPYELPADYKPFAFDAAQWPGDKTSENLIPNLKTYRYANEELAKFVANIKSSDTGPQTVIAATGDHNARSFGQYVTPETQALRYQVPFVVWGAGELACRDAVHQAASHLDMFPTLFPLLGIHDGYLVTGRNLIDCQALRRTEDATSVTFLGQARSNDALWQLGNPKTLACQPVGSVCEWHAEQDSKARARIALMDWNVRHHIHQAIGKK